MMFVKGMALAMPSWQDAAILADVRRRMNNLMGLECRYTEPMEILNRYGERLEKHAVSPITLAA